MIIWLASYPKSGNTLLRSILSSYFYTSDGMFKFGNLNKIIQFPIVDQFMSIGVDIKNDKEVFNNFINAQNAINKNSSKIKFLKTHSSLSKMYDCDFTDLKNTLGSIFVIRDPRNVVTSLAHHNGTSIDDATDMMLNNSTIMGAGGFKSCKYFVGSWSFNYNSWKKLDFNNKYLLVKYEDLINKKKSTILKILKFLEKLGVQFKLDMIKLNKALKSTEFDNMKTLEQKETFLEAVVDNKTGKRIPFFNLGPKNNWRNLLDEKNKLKIEKAFNKEMTELGYI